jgi:Outer membrane protein beta-barrel domain
MTYLCRCKKILMKKFLTSSLVIILSATATHSHAQGFYFRGGLGYGFAQASQTIDGTGQPYSGTLNNSTNATSIKSASFGAGFQGQLGFGYLLNEHVGIQLDANVGLSNKKYTLNVSHVNLGSGVPGSVSIVQQAHTPIMLMPCLVVQSGGEKWNIYSRFGVALPLNTEITTDEIQTNDPNTGALTVDDFTSKMKSSFSLGFTAAAGVQYKFNDRVSMFGELSLLSLSVYTKQSKLTAVTENGQNVPLSYVSGNQVVNYSRNVTVDSTGANQAAYSQPFSNVGFNVGITIKVGSKHHSDAGDKPSSRPRPSKFR